MRRYLMIRHHIVETLKFSLHLSLSFLYQLREELKKKQYLYTPQNTTSYETVLLGTHPNIRKSNLFIYKVQ